MIDKRRTALVIGGSGSIGSVIVDDLLRGGYDVAALYFTNRSRLDAMVHTAAEHGRKLVTLQADMRDEHSIDEACGAAAGRLGEPYAVINAAGIFRDHAFVNMSYDDWSCVLETNLTGTFRLLKRVVPGMIEKREGRIVTISSVSGLHGLAGQVNYASSKAGVIAITKVLARELGPYNITINAIAPGIVETAMIDCVPEQVKRSILHRIPVRRFARPSDILPAVRMCISPEAGYITGQTIVVDGGFCA
ncbi:MAG: SDR family oxidoreductase [Bacteroidetes bacterium]|nr:SDR family oxidoreductase [Bacteroidota bacterium]